MIINEISENSIAEEIGLQKNDKIKAVNGFKINDIIDYRFHISDEEICLQIIRNGQELIFEIEKDIDEELGLSFEPVKYRQCGNNCIFCFIDQNPANLRKDLYFKDEDFRLSFLHGNYVTLTNISKKDLTRIVQQRLSPLYISVHALDYEIRSLMLGLKKDDHLLEKIKFLTDNHIELHTQIVLCPNINDDKYLEQTIYGLSRFYPLLKTMAVVPVGLTKHRDNLYPLKPITPKFSTNLIKTLEPIADKFKSDIGSYFIYLADEFYLNANIKIPVASRYEDFEQYENGVGMLRYFMDCFTEKSSGFPKKLVKDQSITLVTAKLAQPFFESTVIPQLNSIKGLRANLAVIKNDFYGDSVKVTGLITGVDIYTQLRDKPKCDLILLPENCINHDGLFLDDWTVDILADKLGPKIKILGIDFSDLFNYF